MHFTPLRYPGGKGKLASFIKSVISENALLDGEYVEPYAGGAAIALELLLHGYVSRVHINDISRPIFAFWQSVLGHTESLCRLIVDTRCTVKAWDRQKKIFANPSDHDDLALGFATFFLNRTNRSGILNGGMIGGRDQTGEWKIDARYNAKELAGRVQAIAKMKRRIELTQRDALEFLRSARATWPRNTLIYCDPPYYKKGRELYYDFYEPADHEGVAEFVTQKIKRQHWIVSYDNVPEINELYADFHRATYGIGYSARSTRTGSEAMFFSDGLVVPKLIGPLTGIRTRRKPDGKVATVQRIRIRKRKTPTRGKPLKARSKA
jgi:DNA adenine methylase